MNIHEISRATGASQKLLRKLEKLGVLKMDDEDLRAAEIRTTLGRNQNLSLAQKVALIEHPKLIDELGRWSDRAREQLAELGDVTAATVPLGVPAAVIAAARGDAIACDAVADWVRSVLPAAPVSYHWLAIRLVMAQYPQMREQTIRSINLAFNKIRARPKMAGIWRAIDRGGRTTIIYAKPLDL